MEQVLIPALYYHCSPPHTPLQCHPLEQHHSEIIQHHTFFLYWTNLKNTQNNDYTVNKTFSTFTGICCFAAAYKENSKRRAIYYLLYSTKGTYEQL
jgi:hypothetical protein